MSKTDKILVIAGTHQREIEFSHPVADLLIAQYGLDEAIPDNTIIGEDNATKALIWNTKNLVIAKLYSHENGEPTKEWLDAQPLERLMELNQFKMNCSMQKNPPRIAETFGGEGQWTSVHDPIIKIYQPLFFIDLHSYHAFTKGLIGQGMQINSYADKQFNPIISSALKDAQEKDTAIYGQSKTSFTPASKIRSELLPKYFTKEEIVTLLQNNSRRYIETNQQFKSRITSLEREINKFREEEITVANENGWFFVNWGRPEHRGDYYCFEAKHWQKNQQEATAKFIIDYLLPQIEKHN
jgi:hypothetical protein